RSSSSAQSFFLPLRPGPPSRRPRPFPFGTLTIPEGRLCPTLRKMLINVVEPEEARIAVLDDESLEELYVERKSSSTLLGNIYKGRVVSIEPSIQAAFVDFGIDKNVFLHVSDVMHAYGKALPAPP